MNKKTIFVVGGGTGGHFFAAASLGEEMIDRGHEAYLIADKRCERFISEHIKMEVKIINSGTFVGNIFSKAKTAFDIASGVVNSFMLLLSKKPSLVVGFGGYPSFPMLLAAKILRIPIMLHEQNCYLGKANHFFASDAVKIAVAFDEVQNMPKSCHARLVHTGNPVRKAIREVKVSHNFDRDVFHIFICGGSQGASFFSSLMPNVLKVISSSDIKCKLKITQQVRQKNIPKLKRAYNRLNVKHELQEFFHDVKEKYVDSDLMISRAGASTIAEIIELGVPSILIPYPYAANNHQFMNAKYIEKNKMGWCYEQNEITPEIIADKILELHSKRNILKRVSNKLQSKAKDSAKILADTAEEIMSNR